MRRWQTHPYPSTMLACVHNPLNVKHFHRISSRSPHAYLLKSRVGKARKVDRSVIVNALLDNDELWTDQALDQLVERVVSQLTSRLMSR